MVDFLVIGPFSAVAYKEFFPLIKDGVVRLGSRRVGEFTDGTKFGNTIWFSTISDYLPPELELKKQYNEGEYKKFDNYDAIECKYVNKIPRDYDGVIGVPLTFLQKWNPEQFTILGLCADKKYDNEYYIKGEPRYIDEGHKNFQGMVVDGTAAYVRLLIKRKK